MGHLGFPLQIMARSRARQQQGMELAHRFRSVLQTLDFLGPAEFAWQQPALHAASVGGVEIHSLCDVQGKSLQGIDVSLIEMNHRAYATRWGYSYKMHSTGLVVGRESYYVRHCG